MAESRVDVRLEEYDDLCERFTNLEGAVRSELLVMQSWIQKQLEEQTAEIQRTIRTHPQAPAPTANPAMGKPDAADIHQFMRSLGDKLGLSAERKQLLTEMSAEAVGTGFIVVFGVGSVCSAVTSGALTGLWQVAVVWGLGVSLAIYCTAEISGAHLNPAVSLAVAVWRSNDFPRWKLGWYVLAQMLGAIIGGFINLAMFEAFFERSLKAINAERGDDLSIFTASAFGEYFPNPGPFQSEWMPDGKEKDGMVESLPHALLVEAWGTFLLMFVICCVTGRQKALGKSDEGFVAFAIGFTVATLISVYAPITQAGWNPARDFGPRIVAWLAGWGSVAIPGPRNGFWIYIVGPCLGSVVAIPVYEVLIGMGLAQKSSSSSKSGEP